MRTRLLALLGLLVLALPVARPQAPADPDAPRPHRRPPVPDGGFWPTPRMMDLYIDRITDEMSKGFKFDEDQLYNTRELFKRRFPAWLNENRGEIQQLANEWFESLLERQAPDAAYVAKWADRALPLFQNFTALCEDVGGEMRTYLTDEQQTILDGHLGVFRTGVNFMGERLENWRQGGFDAATEWPRSEGFKEADKERQRQLQADADQARREATGDPSEGPANTAAPVAAATTPEPGPRPRAAAPGTTRDEWAQYVEEFIRRYDLNEDQKASAYKLLKSTQEQRDNFLRRTSEQLAESEKALKEARTDAQRAAAEESRKKLRQPLDRMFSTLKERLDQIPTRKQRAAAAQHAAEHRETKTPKTETDVGRTGAKVPAPGTP